jgi:phosphoribosylformylglycinamidine cyclo-ligase
MSHDDPQLLEAIVKGVSDGCVESDMALIGGETAIMPDLYARGDYDLAGFSVGVVEKAKVLDGSTISPGDIVIGIASNGLHSNGFSLVRKIVFDVAKLKVDDPFPVGGVSDRDSKSASETPSTIADVLLRPTTIYARAVHSVLTYYKVKSVVHGIAHITGGGLHENLARILPPGIGVTIDRDSWTMPLVFPWLQKLGEVDDDEMYRVFNMGIGLTLVASPFYAESIRDQLTACGLASWPIGRAIQGNQEVVWA